MWNVKAADVFFSFCPVLCTITSVSKLLWVLMVPAKKRTKTISLSSANSLKKHYVVTGPFWKLKEKYSKYILTVEVEISSNFQSSSSPSYNRQRLVELRAFSSSLHRYRKALHIITQMRHKWYLDEKNPLYTTLLFNRIALANCNINGLLADLGIILCLISWKSTLLRPKLPYFSSYSSRKIARRASSSVKSRALELLGSPLQPLMVM